MKPRMNTDKHGWIGRAGSPLPAVREQAKHGAHGLSRHNRATAEVTRLTCDHLFFHPYYNYANLRFLGKELAARERKEKKLCLCVLCPAIRQNRHIPRRFFYKETRKPRLNGKPAWFPSFLMKLFLVAAEPRCVLLRLSSVVAAPAALGSSVSIRGQKI